MKLKKSSVEQTSEETSGAYISSRLRNPGEEASVSSSGPKETLFGIAAIIATVVMFIVAVVLYLNLDAFTSSGLFVQ